MKLKKLLLLSVALVVIGGIFGFSIWYRWNNDPTIIRQQLPEIKPIAEFSHGTWIRTVAISPVNSNRFVSLGEDNVIKVWNRTHLTAISDLFVSPRTPAFSRASVQLDTLYGPSRKS